MTKIVFISYKYEDSCDTANKISSLLGNNSFLYRGEYGFSSLKQAGKQLKDHIKTMISKSHVTIVIISPSTKSDEWVDWEIKFSLYHKKPNSKNAYRNGILCVVQNSKETNTIEWALNANESYKEQFFPKVLIDNLHVTFPDLASRLSDRISKINNSLDNYDYCVVIDEKSFFQNPTKYIDEAYKNACDANKDILLPKSVH